MFLLRRNPPPSPPSSPKKAEPNFTNVPHTTVSRLRRWAIADVVFLIVLLTAFASAITIVLIHVQKTVPASKLFVHDPAAVCSKGHCYVFAGADEGPGVPYYRSRNSTMAGPWDKVGQVLPAGSEIHEPGEHWRLPWAPAVVEKDSVFYVFYAVTIARTRKSAIGVATCTNLDAPHTWVDHGAIIYTGEGPNADAYPFNVSNAIDPSVLIDPQSSIPILQYGSFFQGIFQVPLADDLLSLRNRNPPFSATHIADDNAAAIKAKSYSVGAHPIEGSALSYHEPYYYVYYAHGVCCQLAKIADTIPLADVYEIRIGRSKNLTGPYVDKNGVGLLNGGGSVFLASQGNVFAPGGPSVTKNSSGTDIFYYHYLDRNGDLEDKHALLGWKPLTYGMDGWPQING